MSDIKIPENKQKPAEFAVSALGNRQTAVATQQDAEPTDRIKVKFEKFVQLVATHDFEGVLKKYADEDVVLSSNLLTDLANAHEEVESHPTKIPVWIISGVIIGVIVTYLIIRL